MPGSSIQLYVVKYVLSCLRGLKYSASYSVAAPIAVTKTLTELLDINTQQIRLATDPSSYHATGRRITNLHSVSLINPWSSSSVQPAPSFDLTPSVQCYHYLVRLGKTRAK
ncbi:hypothetical protein PoB_003587900 [Plakobranchus ocellatus]|uniref:Uncharacterized protein n=1 Tax=Plakobranchus ocellatus TaxID=259542 RepID=A0AAV4ATC1_9GAST|nr:hypothetical protein PoB_003587900 [Plakobranchus ocellatus]